MKYAINILLIILLTIASIVNAQHICIEEVLELEEALYSKKYVEGEQPVYLNYNIKNTDWEGKIVNSNVKIYRDYQNLHFFSKEVTIYQDNEDVLMVLNNQKVVMREKAPKDLTKKGHSDEFIELRKKFLTSCEVVSCTEEKSIKTLILKSKNDMNGALFINKMIYTYDKNAQKVLSTAIYYNKGYKLKEIVINYNEIDMKSTYKFGKSRQYVLDKKNGLLAKYKGFELIDNTKKN